MDQVRRGHPHAWEARKGNESGKVVLTPAVALDYEVPAQPAHHGAWGPALSGLSRKAH